jgi:hypothetical protein
MKNETIEEINTLIRLLVNDPYLEGLAKKVKQEIEANTPKPSEAAPKYCTHTASGEHKFECRYCEKPQLTTKPLDEKELEEAAREYWPYDEGSGIYKDSQKMREVFKLGARWAAWNARGK